MKNLNYYKDRDGNVYSMYCYKADNLYFIDQVILGEHAEFADYWLTERDITELGLIKLVGKELETIKLLYGV